MSNDATFLPKQGSVANNRGVESNCRLDEEMLRDPDRDRYWSKRRVVTRLGSSNSGKDKVRRHNANKHEKNKPDPERHR
ncbi:hypothetical protein AALP_AA2G043000 [Arabis alpina]|uniref:Uncharacterized protein n=1 Tax=Arabis alpina TaxID=50452 RepID=A0A087HF99_ARAAL|nr:hypothetical protein AALP_AA2G043000 [Arabis alpina]